MTRFTPEDVAKHQAKMAGLKRGTVFEGPALAFRTGPEVAPAAAPKPNKYGAHRIEVDGLSFDSKKESRQWQELVLREKAGEISNLRRQVRFALDVNGMRICEYVADFAWTENGAEVIADTKSEATSKIQSYRIKRKLMLAIHGKEILEL